MDAPDSTSVDFEDLRKRAREVADSAYSPYSKVQVGAALLSKSGRVFTGCNVENVSYGATVCAERSALVQAISAGEREFVALALWASPKSLLMPCGLCRQMLYEFSPELEIVIDSSGAGPVRAILSDLLPSGVKPSDLV